MSSEVEDVGTADSTTTPEAGRERALLLADIISDTPARGTNERQLRAINRTVAERMADAGIRPQRVEGGATSGWIVLDFGDVLVHIFSEDQREFYRLEDLWAEAPTLLAIQ